MSRLYLITGFLGAGKTSFLKHFVRLFSGQKLQLIVNEFGKEGVDGALLSDLGACLREITGGSVFCACRMDQFEKVLRESAAENPDVILVEASGLSDPTGVRQLFFSENRFPHIRYMGAVCLVDAVRFPKLYATVRACTRQLAASDVVLLNKTDLASDDALRETRSLIQNQRPDMPVLETSFGQLPPDFAGVLSRARNGDSGKLFLTEDLSIVRITVGILPDISAYELEKFIRMFAEQSFRVKGFLATRDRGTVLADCVGTAVSVSPCSADIPPDKLGVLTILSGAKMPIRSAVAAACQWYASYIAFQDYS
ncbi:MAG: CobW family GTP-binding protein [Eubacteriales bacterium]